MPRSQDPGSPGISDFDALDYVYVVKCDKLSRFLAALYQTGDPWTRESMIRQTNYLSRKNIIEMSELMKYMKIKSVSSDWLRKLFRGK